MFVRAIYGNRSHSILILHMMSVNLTGTPPYQDAGIAAVILAVPICQFH